MGTANLPPILHPAEPLDDSTEEAPPPGLGDLPGRLCSEYAGALLPPRTGFRSYTGQAGDIPGITVRTNRRRTGIGIYGIPLDTPRTVVRTARVYRDAHGRKTTGARCRRESDVVGRPVWCSGWQSGAYQRHELWSVRIKGLPGQICTYMRSEENYPGCAPAIPSLGSASRWCGG